MSVVPAGAQTALSMLCVSPDITVALSSRTITPQQVQCYSFPSGTAAKSFAGIPAGVNVTGYFPRSATQTLLTIDTTAALPTNGTGGTVTVTPHDVASYNPFTGFFFSSLYFAGASNSIPDGTRIDALGIDTAGDLLLSFDVTIAVPKSGGGTITVQPADLVSFNGGVYSLVFNSAAAGIPDGTNLDGATMLVNTDLLLTFDVIGSIAGIDFTPTDVLEFDTGANSWALSFSGASSDGWPDGSLFQGVWAAPLTPTPTPTATATAQPPRDRDAHCDCDAYRDQDCDCDADSDVHCHGDPDANSNREQDADGHGHRLRNSDCHCDGNGHNVNRDGNADCYSDLGNSDGKRNTDKDRYRDCHFGHHDSDRDGDHRNRNCNAERHSYSNRNCHFSHSHRDADRHANAGIGHAEDQTGVAEVRHSDGRQS